jgi:hypothetical protein
MSYYPKAALRVLVLWLMLAVVIYCALHPEQLAFAIGIRPAPAGTPYTYQLWSGFVPAMAIGSVFTGLIGALRHKNCHVTRCWRMGRFPLADGHYKVCHVHHHDENVKGKKVTAEYLHSLHRAHLASREVPDANPLLPPSPPDGLANPGR